MMSLEGCLLMGVERKVMVGLKRLWWEYWEVKWLEAGGSVTLGALGMVDKVGI